MQASFVADVCDVLMNVIMNVLLLTMQQKNKNLYAIPVNFHRTVCGIEFPY